MRKYVFVLISVIGVINILCSSSYARQFAVNFTTTASDAPVLTSDITAGVPEVMQAYWNNLAMTNTDANGYKNKAELIEVVDSTGEVIEGLSVRVGYLQTAQSWSTSFPNWGFKGNNQILQTAGVYPNPDIEITGIPYGAYKVYLYIGCGSNSGTAQHTISKSEGYGGVVNEIETYYITFGWFNNTFVRSIATSPDSTEKGNYIVFDYNTTESFKIVSNGKVSGGWSGVTGIQIVEVPLRGSVFILE